MDIYYPQDKKWDRISHSQAVDGVEFKKRSGFDRSNDEHQVQPQPMQIAQNQMPSTSQQTPAPILRASNLTLRGTAGTRRLRQVSGLAQCSNNPEVILTTGDALPRTTTKAAGWKEKKKQKRTVYLISHV